VNGIYELLCTVTGTRPPVEHAPKRLGDAREAQFDSALAMRELGWMPKVDLLEGMLETYEFFKKYIPVGAA
ncbi:MAG: UDP-glucose 4-epimerase, partial [Candidatus Eremiobacteraeota bacterium]|nr:UDP-glucose 4-epimerase [Candidatus Eremiobacteraeota bacterium]